jgi:hypothetical protein
VTNTTLAKLLCWNFPFFFTIPPTSTANDDIADVFDALPGIAYSVFVIP